MCYGFGAVVTRSGLILFIEPALSTGNISHSAIVDRMVRHRNDFKDLSWIIRDFVRIECPGWTEESFRWDVYSTNEVPIWVDADVVKERCIKLMLRVRDVYKLFKKEKAKLLKSYHETRATRYLAGEDWEDYKREYRELKKRFIQCLEPITGFVPR